MLKTIPLLFASWLRMLLCLALLCMAILDCGTGFCDDQAKSSEDQAQIWIEGLVGPSYRLRRESFLKLCDRSVDIDGWLAKESRNPDAYRASVARWLIRLRKSNGTPAERVMLLNDLESLRQLDTSVLDRYVSEGKWEAMIELVGLLDSPTRRELMAETNRERIIAKAWETENEVYVPRFLDLVLEPAERAYVNQWWSKLGLAQDWHVNDQSNLPSAKIALLESEGKIDEAIDLAKKKSILNQVERLLIRSNRWDSWLTLDTRRIPIVGSQNLVQQKAGVMIMLGRLEEAEKALNEESEKRSNPKLAPGDALLARALGNDVLCDSYLETLPEYDEFAIRRSAQQTRQAFAAIGLDDLSPNAVSQWIESERFTSVRPSLDSEPADPAAEAIRNLTEVSDFLFQLGLTEQGDLVQKRICDELIQKERTEGFAAWVPFLSRMATLNDREKATRLWTEFLVRSSHEPLPAYEPVLVKEDSETADAFQVLYPLAPAAIRGLFESLSPEGSPDSAQPAEVERAIQEKVQQLEDIYAGRLPAQWKDPQKLESLVRSTLARAQSRAEPMSELSLQLAELLDTVGETQLALDTIGLNPYGKQVVQAKAKYLARLGLHGLAADLLLQEFRQDATDVSLFLQCSEQLERAGRFSELDRVQAQALSSVENRRRDMSDQSIYTAPVRREVQVILEQAWLRSDDPDIGWVLQSQYRSAAKDDDNLTKKSADLARIKTLERIKYIWPSGRADFLRLQFIFMQCMDSLIVEAIENKDVNLADSLIRVVHRCVPTDIEFPILFVPKADKYLGPEVADRWFNLFYEPMLRHLEEYPDDHLVGNNTAWLAASCNRNLEKAKQLSEKVTASEPTSTYLDTLAEVEYRLGNVDRAIELSERCRILEPKSQHHRDQLKRFHERQP